jgi:hypothetical protein
MCGYTENRHLFHGKLPAFFLFLILFFRVGGNICAIEDAGEKRQRLHHGIFRINSDISVGSESIEFIARKASEHKLDFIVVSDQFIVRAEYGFPPFRNVINFSKEKTSITTFGGKKYLELLKNLDANNRIVIIPGADIAPHYFWETKSIFEKPTCRQFSRQLTVFGPLDEALLQKLPVIHNSSFDMNPWSVFKKLYPLSLVIIVFLIWKKKIYYADNQGNRYYRRSSLKQKIFAGLVFIVSILWTLDKKPFSTHHGFDPYADYGRDASQKVIDYIREHAGNTIGIVWSAPEAKSSNMISEVRLISENYVEDILKTDGHNGFAGIYGDKRTAHLPGAQWDQMLLEYCAGKRKTPAFVFGETDYHGTRTDIPFDFIKTVVFLGQDETPTAQNISKAMISGSSYAVHKKATGEIVIDEFKVFVPNTDKKAFSGQTLEVTRNDPVKILISGRCSSVVSKDSFVEISFICNGRKFASPSVNIAKFNLEFDVEQDILTETNNYVRFIVNDGDYTGELLSNPIFIKKKRK